MWFFVFSPTPTFRYSVSYCIRLALVWFHNRRVLHLYGFRRGPIVQFRYLVGHVRCCTHVWENTYVHAYTHSDSRRTTYELCMSSSMYVKQYEYYYCVGRESVHRKCTTAPTSFVNRTQNLIMAFHRHPILIFLEPSNDDYTILVITQSNVTHSVFFFVFGHDP